MILVIDNYDSFTYNLVQYLGELGAEPMVRRNDEVTVDEIEAMRPDAMVLSPGPGTPADAGITIAAVRGVSERIPTLGVCLGHQAIAEAYGGKVVRANQLMHGKTSMIGHLSKDIFDGVESPLEVMRYHSLTVDPGSLPKELEVLAWAMDDESEIHAMRHRVNPVWGVQFHPESVMTRSGRTILENFLRMAR
ncbi:MAG TPA: aminodeoxychorismate/anthranilate synthase component II [Gemmatimonadaceae bacterium]|nr:aminodeoxychorismate/anthranilate synthase component II [Gemmatimonadaceae bacterium]